MSPSRGAAAPKASNAVPVFVALGDPIRLRLLGRLSVDGPLSITRLSRGTAVTRQAITKHLHTLPSARRAWCAMRAGGVSGSGSWIAGAWRRRNGTSSLLLLRWD